MIPGAFIQSSVKGKIMQFGLPHPSKPSITDTLYNAAKIKNPKTTAFPLPNLKKPGKPVLENRFEPKLKTLITDKFERASGLNKPVRLAEAGGGSN